jgi:hypothetical protein
MNNYQQFSLMDFIQDADFIRWVREKRPADQQFWEEWLSLYPDKAPLIEEARHVLASIDIIPPKIIPRELIQLETQKLLQAIGASLPHQAPEAESPLPSARTLRLFKWKLAAAALILTAAALLYLFRPQTASSKKFAYSSLISSRHLIEKINTSSSKEDSILFADGSLIRLGPNSRISYPAGFDTAATREVYLSGEAFFHIAKNPHHSFRVIAGEVVTKVLGTSFCVHSYEKDTTIQVVVLSGKVSVYSQAIAAEQTTQQAGHSVIPGSQSGIILTCNQRLVYRKVAQKFQKLLLESPSLITPGMTDENMVYEDTPLEEVFTHLGKAYGINIVYDNELVKKSTVTADLKGETFYHKLDLICRAIGAEYEVIDGQVVISFSNNKPNLNE